MTSGTDQNEYQDNYFDIREAPRYLRRVIEERQRMCLGERAYRRLKERGQMREFLDCEVQRMRDAFRKLVEEFQAKRCSDREAHERAWFLLLKNWPSWPYDREPEKKVPAKKEPSSWANVVAVTAKNGRRYMLLYEEPMSEEFKQFVRTLQGKQCASKQRGKRKA